MDEEGFLRLIVESEVQDPVGIYDFLGLGPPNQCLSSCHGDDCIGFIIDRDVLKCLSAPVQAMRAMWCPLFGRNVIGHGTDLGVWVQPENHVGIIAVGELLGEVCLLNFPADLLLAYVANDCTPISTFLVEGCHLVVGLLVGDVGNKLGVPESLIYPR
ncbi:hypothetical protein D3C77_287020 [compost metagenome]